MELGCVNMKRKVQTPLLLCLVTSVKMNAHVCILSVNKLLEKPGSDRFLSVRVGYPQLNNWQSAR